MIFLRCDTALNAFGVMLLLLYLRLRTFKNVTRCWLTLEGKEAKTPSAFIHPCIKTNNDTFQTRTDALQKK